MEKIMLIVPNVGFIRLKLEKNDVIVTEVPKEMELKFKKQYPDGVIGNSFDWHNQKKLWEMIDKFLKSLQ